MINFYIITIWLKFLCDIQNDLIFNEILYLKAIRIDSLYCFIATF